MMPADGADIDISKGRDGMGTCGVGFLRVVDGEFYLDEVKLKNYLGPYINRYCELAVFFPAEHYVPPAYQKCDKKIQPLVSALNAVGVQTFSSCEGHLQERYGMLIPRPYVWVYLKDWNAKGLTPPEGWELSQNSSDSVPLDGTEEMCSLHTVQTAATEPELHQLQKQVEEYAEALLNK